MTQSGAPSLIGGCIMANGYTRDEMREYMRFRRLPEMIERTEAKLARLYAEARSIGMKDLEFGFTSNDAWEREASIAKIEWIKREADK